LVLGERSALRVLVLIGILSDGGGGEIAEEIGEIGFGDHATGEFVVLLFHDRGELVDIFGELVVESAHLLRDFVFEFVMIFFHAVEALVEALEFVAGFVVLVAEGG
jgi:hypothetical protein